MSLHRIPSIDRQMYRRAHKNVQLEKLLESLTESNSVSESESKDSDYNRFVSESGVRYDFSKELNSILQKKLFDSLEKDSSSMGLSYNYFGNSFNPWDFLK